ncbi:glycosyl hydrolase family 71-domain-containing protein [Mycena rosella]|uniref:Glycosyl hydrolase family 71-domain-containing protein n=1 Tax=Mycena rosella TaxID=1033263 RepID=A0AAD7DRZ1_MYCRO|nr:glycosyl hydrolase family 71-domain-containing protein [Mycena rosella]
MVGNAEPYTVDNWANDIALASSKGLEGFILNLGSDSWQPDKVADAFTAAKSAGSDFRISFSFDMTKYITTYSGHPNVLQFAGKMLVSTFSGEKCTFGQGSVDAGWASTVKMGVPPVHFVPAFFVDPATLGIYHSADGAFNWNGGWPQSPVKTSFDTDMTYISALGRKTYLGVLFSTVRWEVLIQNRQQVPIVEVITWNDYGESHYVGPIEGAQPNSQAWVNGFDHQDPCPIPLRYPDWASDTLWAQFHLTQPADLTLTCGSSSQTFSGVPAAVSKQKLPLTEDYNIAAKITRDGSDAVTFEPAEMTFSTKPLSYNFNAFVAASPA